MKKRTQILAFLAALTLCAATPVSAFAETEDAGDLTESTEISDTDVSSEEESSDTEETDPSEESSDEESSDTEETDPSEESSDEESSDTEETDPSEESSEEESSDTEETDPSEEATERQVGDVTGDGLADSDDASVYLNYYACQLVSIESPYDQLLAEIDMEISDVNKDGVLDADDAGVVLYYYCWFMSDETITMEMAVNHYRYSGTIRYNGEIFHFDTVEEEYEFLTEHDLWIVDEDGSVAIDESKLD